MEKEETDEGKNILYRFRKTHKAFLLEYGCAFFLIIFYVIFTKKELLTDLVNYVVLGLGLTVIAAAEITRQMELYEITHDKIIITHGLFRKDRKYMYLQPLNFIPNIHLKQNIMQRFWNYGSLSMKGEGDNQIEIDNINKPKEMIRIIEEVMEHHRHENAGKHSPRTKIRGLN